MASKKLIKSVIRKNTEITIKKINREIKYRQIKIKNKLYKTKGGKLRARERIKVLNAEKKIYKKNLQSIEVIYPKISKFFSKRGYPQLTEYFFGRSFGTQINPLHRITRFKRITVKKLNTLLLEATSGSSASLKEVLYFNKLSIKEKVKYILKEVIPHIDGDSPKRMFQELIDDIETQMGRDAALAFEKSLDIPLFI